MDKIFNKPFAVNGARVAIPENGTENERVSFDKGFTQPYEVEAPSVDNPAGQGFNILRPEMNEALYQLSNACNVLAENIDKWTALTTENLNNITQKGRYFQATQSQATNANNYPSEQTGYLLVFDSVNGNVSQFYKVANKNTIFSRVKNGNEWGAWDSFVLNSEVYTKTEVNNLIISTNGFSRTGWIDANVANATIPIPNKNVTGCCILVTAFYSDNIDGKTHGSDFIFKIDGAEVGRVRIRWSRSGASGTMFGVNQTFINLSGKLGKTIVPSVTHLANSKFEKANFLVVWE